LANPQAENGHTDIANEIMDALAKTRIPGEARQVLDFIFRKTYGWHKKEDDISLSQFVDGTGMSKTRVCQAINKLTSMNLITKKGNNVTEKGNGWCSTYCFNKDFHTWKPLPKKEILKGRVSITEIKNKIRVTDGNACMVCGYEGHITKEFLPVHHIDFNQTNNTDDNLITLCKSCHGKSHTNRTAMSTFLRSMITEKRKSTALPKKEMSVTEKGKESLPKTGHTKENSTKETTKEKSINHENEFMVRWNRYPNKDGKKEALRHFKATVNTLDELAKIDKALDNYITHLAMKENAWKKPKNGSTWFNNWQDWVEWQEPKKPEGNTYNAAQEELAKELDNVNYTSQPVMSDEANTEFKKFGMKWTELQRLYKAKEMEIFNVAK